MCQDVWKSRIPSFFCVWMEVQYPSCLATLFPFLWLPPPLLHDVLYLMQDNTLLCVFNALCLCLTSSSSSHLSSLPYYNTMQVMIIIAQVNRSQESLMEPIFWGIRLTVIGLAVNPFLYGVLAGQYRQAYAYVLRLLLSKCCACVNPPKRNVFGRWYIHM